MGLPPAETHEVLRVGNWKPSSKAPSMKEHWLDVALRSALWAVVLATREYPLLAGEYTGPEPAKKEPVG